ncbi:MAG TPA: ABC transporter ATP-binding protein [Glaciihabitans sp.]|nr:ABC transporter ATP-binding protein [Glaciihabitans sp.]
MAESTFLQIRKLRKEYPGTATPAVADIDLSVGEGELLALLGPSGCGKTTTLRMIAGLIEPTAGTIEVGGQDVTRIPVHKRGMGMVFQSFALFPHLDVSANVAFGLEMRGVKAAERRSRTTAVLERVELGHLADRRVGQLSGGQQQRVALARALVVDPTLLLLDEPLSALDAKLRESLRVQIREIQQASGTTSVFVTHDQDEALSMADRVAVMNNGIVAQVGTPTEIYERPASVFVATFIGRANLFETQQVSAGVVDVAGFGKLSTAASALPLGSVTAMIRPQSIHLLEADATAPELLSTPARPVFDGVVRSTSYTGDQVAYRVDVSGTTLEVETTATLGRILSQGDRVRVTWSSDDLRLLGK